MSGSAVEIKLNDGSVVIVGGKSYREYFDTEVAAALTYDEMANEHFGEFAKLNFPLTAEGNDLTRTKEPKP